MNDNTLVTYVINLKRSTERMENMDRALKAMQVDYERVEGVDAQRLSEDLLSRNATPRGVSGFLCLGRLFQGQPNEAALCI